MPLPVIIVLVIAGVVLVGVFAALFRHAEEEEVRQRQREFWEDLPRPATPPPAGPRCPKCGEPMELGFIPDFNHRMIGLTIWVEGPPRAGGHGTDADWHRSIPVGTYRCPACGYLESYARPEFAHREARP